MLCPQPPASTFYRRVYEHKLLLGDVNPTCQRQRESNRPGAVCANAADIYPSTLAGSDLSVRLTPIYESEFCSVYM